MFSSDHSDVYNINDGSARSLRSSFSSHSGYHASSRYRSTTVATEPNRDGSMAGSPVESNSWTIGATEGQIVHNAADPTAPATVSFTSTYEAQLFHQSSTAVESILGSACEVTNMDIAEVWLRTGPKTHQLINSHLRPTALIDESVRRGIVDVYYGERSSERTHRLSPALCKRAKETMDVVWVTAHSEQEAQALRASLSNVQTAVAVPVCHEASNTNVTFIFFSIRKAVATRSHATVEFLVHMSLAAASASVHLFEEELFDRKTGSTGASSGIQPIESSEVTQPQNKPSHATTSVRTSDALSQSERPAVPQPTHPAAGHPMHHLQQIRSSSTSPLPPLDELNLNTLVVPSRASTASPAVSVTGANLELQWRSLQNVEYLTDGGNSWIHTAVLNGRPVVVKTLKPECQDLAVAMNEIEDELEILAQINHPNICALYGAGYTSRRSRFVVLERLDGGTLGQALGYKTRIRDRRKRFWKRKKFTYEQVLKYAREITEAMIYCHHNHAIADGMLLHRDLKPDNIGFTLDGSLKIFDFGLARVIHGSSPDDIDGYYDMSGECGSLRYMAPEVADSKPYNHKVDVYSFAIILWEMMAFEKPFDGMTREEFYQKVVHDGERPPINKKWPENLVELMTSCWSRDPDTRPSFKDIANSLDVLMGKKKSRKGLGGLIDRHSTWF